MNKQNKKAFTLVELIVVITILAILGTIAFISLQGYSKSARDSKRLSDVQNIKKSLELFSIKTGKYPIPDNSFEVTYETELVWTQGLIGDIVVNNLSKNLSKKPIDPLTGLEYTYSTINKQNKYEVLSIFESDLLSYNNLSLNQANALTNVYPKIDGTYNGVFVKTSNYYIPTPSLINAELNGSGIILNQNNIKSQITTGGSNIITNGLNLSSTGGLENLTLQVFTGSISAEDNTNKELLANKLILAYSGTILSNEGIYAKIVETDINDFNALIGLVDEVVIESKNYTNNTPIYDNCDFNGNTILHNGSITSYETETVTFGNTCNNEQRTCNDGNLSGTFTFTGCTVDGATGTFTLSKIEMSLGEDISIFDNCTVAPTNYTSSDTSVATISGSIITSISTGTTNISQIGGSCEDISPKLLTVNETWWGAWLNDNKGSCCRTLSNGVDYVEKASWNYTCEQTYDAKTPVILTNTVNIEYRCSGSEVMNYCYGQHGVEKSSNYGSASYYECLVDKRVLQLGPDVDAPIGGDFTIPKGIPSGLEVLSIKCPVDIAGSIPIDMYISGDILETPNWELCTDNKNITFVTGTGTKNINVKWRDALGNETNLLTKTLIETQNLNIQPGYESGVCENAGFDSYTILGNYFQETCVESRCVSPCFNWNMGDWTICEDRASYLPADGIINQVECN